MYSTDSFEGYCPECECHRTSDYCPDCGTDTKKRNPDSIDWPIEFTFRYESIEDRDVMHDIRKQLDHSQILPDELDQREYWVGMSATSRWKVTIYEDGTNDVELIED